MAPKVVEAVEDPRFGARVPERSEARRSRELVAAVGALLERTFLVHENSHVGVGVV
jgi:hypothetical protein